jgi:hypothetical protein
LFRFEETPPLLSATPWRRTYNHPTIVSGSRSTS